MNINDIFTWVGNVSNVVGLATLGTSAITLLLVRQQNRRYKEKIKGLAEIKDFQQLIAASQPISTGKPIALGFSLTPTPGEARLKGPITELLKREGMEMDIRIIDINGINNSKDLETLYEQAKQAKQAKLEIEAENYTEIHLFIDGPVQAGTIIGCLFSNWRPVKLYHYNQLTKDYEYCMPLLKI